MAYVHHDKRARGAGVEEYETHPCRHCQAAVRVYARGQVGGRWCNRCGGHVCDKLECLACTPWKQKVDQRWEQIHRSEQFAEAAGLAGGKV